MLHTLKIFDMFHDLFSVDLTRQNSTLSVLGDLWFTNQALIKPEKAAVKIKVTDTVSYGCPDLN